MEQRTRRRLAFIGVGALMPIGGFLLAAACGTDNGTTDTPKNDSGRTDTSSSSSSSSSGDSSGTSSGGDAAPDCSAVPNVKSSIGPFCFGVADASADGGTKSINCNSANDQVCCGDSKFADGGFAPSTCEPATVNGAGGYNDACNGKYQGGPGSEWHCLEKAHCPGTDEYCCLTGSDAGFPKPGENFDYKGCENAKFQSGKFHSGTRCRKTACQQGEQTLCASDADCKAGTCTHIAIQASSGGGSRFTGYCRVTTD